MTAQLPSVMRAKDQAKQLREKRAEDGRTLGHAKSLELIALHISMGSGTGMRCWQQLETQRQPLGSLTSA